jgi:hypothetical protein
MYMNYKCVYQIHYPITPIDIMVVVLTTLRDSTWLNIVGARFNVTDGLRHAVGREEVSAVVVVGQERVDVLPVQTGLATYCCALSPLVIRPISSIAILV